MEAAQNMTNGSRMTAFRPGDRVQMRAAYCKMFPQHRMKSLQGRVIRQGRWSQLLILRDGNKTADYWHRDFWIEERKR